MKSDNNMDSEKQTDVSFTKITPKESNTVEPTPSWRTLLHDYTQETTLHGLRYVTLQSVFRVRRLFWSAVLLVALAVFLKLVADKIIKLKSYPKTVNVEVNYNESIEFPAVTICNSNNYRLTALQQHGLFDLILNEYPLEWRRNKLENPELEECVESYTLHLGICGIPYQDTYQRKSSVGVAEKWLMEFGEVTRGVCQHVCSNLYGLSCNSVLYNRDKRSCVLSSYAGTTEPVHCANNGMDSPYEFYSKHRCVEPANIKCTFEEDCILKNDLTATDEWIPVTAQQVGNPGIDNTMATGSGHYLYLLDTDNRQNYQARYYTNYVNTTGKCLRLAYLFLGYDRKTKLSVIAITEDKVVQLRKTVYNKGSYTTNVWYQMSAELPSGVNIVILEGTRGSKSAGIAVDDLEIFDCSLRQADCITTRFGKGYTGLQSFTKSGRQCVKWSELNQYILPRDLPDESLEAANNYCRSEAFRNGGPGCFIDYDINSIDSHEDCQIDYCKCKENEFPCSNNFCLSQTYICDGFDDCGDASDEWEPCKEKRNIVCHFDDPFVCGYVRPKSGPFHWRHISVSDAALETGTMPAHHPLENEGHKMIMLLSSGTGQRGDRAYLHTPLKTSAQAMNFSFYIFMDYSFNDYPSRFEIYINDGGILTQQLLLYYGGHPEWQFKSIALPEGIYSLSIIGVMGTPFQSDIGFASVMLSESDVNLTMKGRKFSINCTSDFEVECGYSQYGKSYLFSWETVNKNSLSILFAHTKVMEVTPGCGGNHLSLKGNITSPNYPSADYSNNLRCHYFIPLPDGFKMNVTFVAMDLEPKGSAACYDYIEMSVYNGTHWTSDNKLYCGNRYSTLPDPIVLSGGSLVQIELYTDHMVQRSGFHLQYELDGIINDRDIGIASKYTGPFSEDEYSTILATPPIGISSTHCLAAVVYSSSNLTIYHQLSDNLGKVSTQPLLMAPGHLGDAWHRITLELEPSTQPFNVLFGSTTVKASDTYTCALKSVYITQGNCMNAYGVSGNVSCTFADQNQCGYVDQSLHTLKWIRMKYREADNSVSVSGSGSGSETSSGIDSGSGSGGDGVGGSSSGDFPVDSGSGSGGGSGSGSGSGSGTSSGIDSGSGSGGDGVGGSGSGDFPVDSRSGSVIQFDDYIDCDILRCQTYDYMMSVMIVPTGQGPAVLMSPPMSNTQTRCLQMDTVLKLKPIIKEYFTAIVEFNIYVFDEDTLVKSPLLSKICDFTAHSWKLVQVNLPVGRFRVIIEVRPLLPGSVLSSSFSNVMFQIANVTVLEDQCDEPTIVPTTPSAVTNTLMEVTTDIPATEGQSTTETNSKQNDLNDYLGPPQDYYDFLTNIHSNLTTIYARKILAHKKENMIARCGWGGEEDNCEPIESRSTEAGYCYTFNSLEEQPLRTNRTGADFGFKVLLNIEKYQYSDVSEVSDTGIKVHLHMQYEVPSVSDMGFAVPPGAHALASITYSKTESLEPPWGSCSSIPLFNTTKYTRLRCENECNSNATIDVCKCREDAIRANVRECLLNDTLNCVYPQKATIIQKRSICDNDCPEACEVTTLPVSLSYSNIAGGSLLKQFTSEQLSSLYNQNKQALDLRTRVSNNLFHATLQCVLNVISNYSSYFNFLSYQAFDLSTSVVMQTVNAANKFIKVAKHEIVEVYLSEMEEYSQNYTEKSKPSIEAINTALRNARTILVELKAALIIINTDYRPIEGYWAPFIVKANEAIHHAYSTYTTFTYYERARGADHMVPSLGNLTYDMDLRSVCEDFCTYKFRPNKDKLKIFLENIEDNLSKYETGPLDAHQKDLIDSALSTIDILYNGMGNLEHCISDYGDLLEAIQAWKDQLDFNLTAPKDIETDTYVDAFQSSVSWLNDILDKYAANLITKDELAEIAFSQNITDILELIQSINTVFTSRISPDIKAKIEDKYVLMRVQYQQALFYLASLQKYISSKKLENVGRSIKLWLKPYPVIDSPKVIAYEYNGGEQWRTWPKMLSLESFQKKTGSSTIRRLVKIYFDELQSLLTHIDTEVASREQRVTTAIEEMQNFFREYKNDLIIDGEFLNDNFLQLNVFFGELKYEYINQLRGYDVATLFSEIGGYMGLLLGGSVITVIEFIDLFIYNFFRKGLERKKAKVIHVMEKN